MYGLCLFWECGLAALAKEQNPSSWHWDLCCLDLHVLQGSWWARRHGPSKRCQLALCSTHPIPAPPPHPLLLPNTFIFSQMHQFLYLDSHSKGKDLGESPRSWHARKDSQRAVGHWFHTWVPEKVVRVQMLSSHEG